MLHSAAAVRAGPLSIVFWKIIHPGVVTLDFVDWMTTCSLAPGGLPTTGE